MLFLMVLAVVSGAVVVSWRQSHVRIEAIAMRLPLSLRRVVAVLIGLMSIAVLLVVGSGSFDVVQLLFSFDQRSDALDAPMWLPQSVLTVGLFLMALIIMVRLIFPAPAPQAHLGQD